MEMMLNKQEYILCAAIHFDDGNKYSHQPKNIESGFVIAGRRQGNCFLTFTIFDPKLLNKQNCKNEIQGFITSHDRFVNRKEAGQLAFKSKQIDKPTECLISEDLY